jgi:hypothetical protein
MYKFVLVGYLTAIQYPNRDRKPTI